MIRLGASFRRNLDMGCTSGGGAASYRYGDGGIHGLDNEIVILVESVYYFHEQPGNAHLFSYL